MAAAGIILIPILFIIAVFCMGIIPVVVALIYRGSYNRHLNEQLNSDGTMRKWISPVALGLIIFLAEVIIMVGITAIGVINYSALNRDSDNSAVDLSDNRTETYLPGDLPEEYAVFDGSEVDGYLKEEREQDGFHYYAYKLNSGEKIGDADYMLVIDYNGKAIYNQASSSLQFEIGDGSVGQGIMVDKSDRYDVVIDLGKIIYRTVTVKDGTETTNEMTMKPDDVEVEYDMILMNVPNADDIDSLDFDALTSDTMAAEIKVDLEDLWE